MKVLVIGAEGQLGTAICAAFSDVELYRADRDGSGIILDIRNHEAARNLIAGELRPDVVVNTAAAHHLAQCEEKPDWAFAVNAIAVKHVAAASQACGARLIHISTDYVFGHGASRPLTETDLPGPLNVYGASKLAGEYLIATMCADYCVVRTAALYGPAPCRAKGGENFVGRMLRLAAARGQVEVVTDEITTPTYTVSLARQIRVIAERGKPGWYHATSRGACSWYEFAKAIFEYSHVSVKVTPMKAKDLQSPVRRPSYSVLENRYLQDQGLDIMPPWRDALQEYLSTLKNHEIW
jgi:dTDP-4-dehydrorhamnose reductase